MADIAIFRINYKSDFILTLHSDAGWATPFCIKFWTGAPSQAYYAGWDGTTYTNCAADSEDPTKLTVQFDDHHLPIGDLKYQISYHFTVADFPTSIEDEVFNQEPIIVEIGGEQKQVMLDFNGDTAPEIEFNLPAYTAEEERKEAEKARQEAEEARQEAEEARQEAEEERGRVFTEKVTEMDSMMQSASEATLEAEQSAARADTAIAEANAATARTNAAIAEAQEAARNAKADYIGEDSYVYHWSIAEQRYVKTGIYVRGKDGKSAYQAAVEAGYQGTEEEFNRSMLGAVEVDGILLGKSSIPVFPTGLPYAQETLFLYENKLYRAIEQITSSTWDATKATETSLFGEVERLGEAANEQINVILTREGEDIATQFDSSSDYAIGDYVFYNGSLYRFTTAHAAGNAWDGTKVTEMGSKVGVSVFFNVEGETNPRTVVTDANGRASTIVAKGLLVTISANAIQGYYNPNAQQIRTALPMRNVYIPYTTDLSGDYENMLVTFSYADPNNSAKASSITVNVFTDSTRQTIENTFTVSVDNDEARFAVLHGKYYSVVFPSVDVYAAIGTINFKAKYSNRQFTAYYLNASLGFDWIKYDGGIIGVQQIKPEDEPDIAGLLVHDGKLQFIISKNVIVAQKKMDNNRREFPLANFTSENTAITDIDGQSNTNIIYQLDQDTGQTSDTFAVPYAKQQTLTFHIGGEDVSYNGFIPAYGQFKFLINNYNTLVTVFGVLGKTFPNIKTSVWNTSTEYSNEYMARVSNGTWAGGAVDYQWKEMALNLMVVFPIISSGDDD